MEKKEIIIPKLGEGIIEVSIVKLLKKPGDKIKKNEALIDIATDKVDSEIISPYNGTVASITVKENTNIPVGTVVAMIETSEGPASSPQQSIKPEKATTTSKEVKKTKQSPKKEIVDNKKIKAVDKMKNIKDALIPNKKEQEEEKQPIVEVPFMDKPNIQEAEQRIKSDGGEEGNASKFAHFSPLILSIAQKEKISIEELCFLQEQKTESRINKHDLFEYIKRKNTVVQQPSQTVEEPVESKKVFRPNTSNFKIEKLDRVRKIIAQRMVESKATIPHASSYMEVDVSKVVAWKSKNAPKLLAKEGVKLTYTPIFIKLIAKTIKALPRFNASLDGDEIYLYEDVNIGMGTALPDGNLVVPVIQNADLLSIKDLTKQVIHLATAARTGKLISDEISFGTHTISNIGSYNSWMGIPIIPVGQSAISVIGSIEKKIVLQENLNKDVPISKYMMLFGITFDHRIIDGLLSGNFIKTFIGFINNLDKDEVL